jgi:hypothetical protein
VWQCGAASVDVPRSDLGSQSLVVGMAPDYDLQWTVELHHGGDVVTQAQSPVFYM